MATAGRVRICQAGTLTKVTNVRQRATKEHCLEERSGEEDVDSRMQVEGWKKMEAAAPNRAQDGQW